MARDQAISEPSPWLQEIEGVKAEARVKDELNMQTLPPSSSLKKEEEQVAVAEITSEMPKIPASPSSVETEVQGGQTNGRDMYKYRGYSWPGVVGLDVHEAKRIIAEGKPELRFEVLSKNAMRTCEGRAMRVRLIVDRYNRVVETPRVG